MIKKLLLPCLLFFTVAAKAQLNNSWIDYSKTYYKFKLANDKICRIPQTTLSIAGIPATTNADAYQLWKNGQQIRLFTSVSGIALGAADYIEFFGEMNDGKADKQLYRDPQFQLADRYSLETDTATYFLTTNTASANLRYTNTTNAAPSAATPDAYFMRSINVYYKDKLNAGFGQYAGEYVYSASYDNGEGFTTTEKTSTVDTFNVLTPANYTENITGLNVYTAGPANGLSIKARGYFNTYGNSRKLGIKLFGNVIMPETVTNGPVPLIFDANNLPLSYLQNTTNAPIDFTMKNLGVFYSTQPYQTSPNYVPNERLVIATVGITYPATFNFNNQKSFQFNLAASATGNYLVIDNFDYGATAPVLYDMNTGKRYTGDIASTPGKVKFVLPASTDPTRKFLLNNADATNIATVSSVLAKTFVNYNTPANRGDYIIISNPVLYNDGTGANPVDDYKTYRNSINGGSHNAKIYDINELRDQFAFGLKSHPAAVRDFVRFMDVNYPVKPTHIFIIGRGLTYQDRRLNESDPVTDKLDMVTTFGWPSSDILMVSQPNFPVPITPVGRIAAVSGVEVRSYLQKVIAYEAEQKKQSPIIADKAWMKNVMQIVGGRDNNEQQQFGSNMDYYATFITADTLFGGNVDKFVKTSSTTVQQASSDRITQLFEEGLGVISYFGHSSATTFEFNLGNPEIYNNTGKYPFFNISGCNAGNFYNFDPQRLNAFQSLSEKYILTANHGSIGFLANTHFGIPGDLFNYDSRFYQNFSQTMYGATVGEQIKEVTSYLGGNDINLSHEQRIHLEEINLHGDPAIKVNNFPKPDYVIEPQLVKISPSIITVSDPFFVVKVKMQNLGRATKDSIKVYVKRLLPNTTVPVTIFDAMIPGIKYADSLTFNIPINPSTDAGVNKIMVELDYTHLVPELYETNNYFTTDVVIFENALNPISPYNYAIVNAQNITFSASTANPLLAQSDYVMEIDTTDLFNSAFKKTYNKSGVGGLINFVPTNLTFTDSTVYYWRTAVVPITGAYIWNKSSFVYLSNSTAGYNQSHYYQYLKNDYATNIFMNTSRKLQFTNVNTALNISTGNYPPNDYPNTYISLGAFTISSWGKNFNTLQFTVLDGYTGVAKRNTVPGLYGSNQASLGTSPRLNQFEFYFGTEAQRKVISAFIDSMPSNAIIMVYPLLLNSSVNSYVSSWQTDAPATSLYNKLKGYGFTKLDSFYRNIPMFFKFTKDNSSPSFQKVGSTATEIITASLPINVRNLKGEIISEPFGPATAWSQFHWRGSTEETPSNDKISFDLIGVSNTGIETNLMSIDSTMQDVDISSISASTYPYIKIKMTNIDSAKGTPHQLRYWRMNYTPAPEGAIAPNIAFTMRDTVEAGDPIDFSVAFKNISASNFASTMKLKMVIKTNNNFDSVIVLPNGKVLVAGDTLKVSYKIPTENYLGSNTLVLEVNPANSQLEQYHFNNFLYKNFFVKGDKVNPLLDVTFDGIHILSRDIVASKPDILVKLNDDSKYLGLTDNSLLKVQLKYPDQTIRDYNFNTDTLRFTPANIAIGENTASINFKPYLPKDGDYELIVTGKDRSGNKAGAINYNMPFRVINKAMISEMLNYPNPFTTSTAFVFTLTGSVVPQNIRIQVLTITGKVVREITKDELGPLHIGRNVTAFKWDGTDMYGQQLANGVYIYRVITNLNGSSLEKYKANGDDTEKYFKKGYGKMYLIR